MEEMVTKGLSSFYGLAVTDPMFLDNSSNVNATYMTSPNMTDVTGTWIRYYVIFVVAVMGTISNILALLVVGLSRHMRSSPSGVLLLCLTALDTVVLISERIVTLNVKLLGAYR